MFCTASIWHNLTKDFQSKWFQAFGGFLYEGQVQSSLAWCWIAGKPLLKPMMAHQENIKGYIIMVLTHWFLEDLDKKNRWAISSQLYWLMPEVSLWNCSQMNVTGPHSWLVNIGSGNDLLPSGNKPLPEPVLTEIYIAIWHHWVSYITVGALIWVEKNFQLFFRVYSCFHISP